MRRLQRVLHITPHLGGGVGRALVSLVKSDALSPTGQKIARKILCLEQPQKSSAIRELEALGVPVKSCISEDDLIHAVSGPDLIQFEVWNHPRLFGAWHKLRGRRIRSVHWCHVSGLGFPKLPDLLWKTDQIVALTSYCSLEGGSMSIEAAISTGRVHVISSAAGFEDWPNVPRRMTLDENRQVTQLRLGYIGSLNFSKMHPNYVDWCVQAVKGQRVMPRMMVLGEEVVPGYISSRCASLGSPGLVLSGGFCTNVVKAMEEWDAFLYLLNPYHYGTAEIALIEAMASQLVPVVLPNPCEAAIVEHGARGWHVTDPKDLSETLTRMRDHPMERVAMGEAASDWVRSRYTKLSMAQGFEAVYAQAWQSTQRPWNTEPWMGQEPWQWFLATQPSSQTYIAGRTPNLPTGYARYGHLERTKGSVHHFASAFPEDTVLQSWSRDIRDAYSVQAELPCELA